MFDYVVLINDYHLGVIQLEILISAMYLMEGF